MHVSLIRPTSVKSLDAMPFASHSVAADKKGMTAGMFGELMSVVGVANANNRLANGYQVSIDEMFRQQTQK